ncbi:unnamed protein product [Phytophthora fragariaefolia]|uniref:Unnamed protein product n=1 Tax=Phytophthora fragariaefolia TaxID=1490495 RepID=A0A9W6WXX8_9STRA|nr:unnamed protein product [Phytophthora fragariaefolia]
MNSSILYPPNFYDFIDKVIRDVILRDRHLKHQVAGSDGSFHIVATRRASVPGLNGLVNASHYTDRKCMLREEVKSKTVHRQKQTAQAPLSTNEVGEKYSAKLEWRRMRNRIHQARYKRKQRQHIDDLEETIKHLQKEVKELEVWHCLVPHSVPTDSRLWDVVAQYFTLFRHGVKTPISALLHNNQYQAQYDFIQTTMALDEMDGTVYGIKTLMKHFELQSRCYEDVDLQPTCLVSGPENSIIATTRCVLTITKGTLRRRFPHLVGHLSHLADKMLGRRITLQGSVHFVWDAARGRVTQLFWRVDMMLAFLKLFGNLEDVERIFNGARISPEGLVREE